MHAEGMPSVMARWCFECPEGSSPDDFVDYAELWRNLCAIVQTHRLSSTITTGTLSKSLSLRRAFARPPANGVPQPPCDDAADRKSVPGTTIAAGRRKRDAEEFEDLGGKDVTAVLHAALVLTRHPERGREFVCAAQEGLAAGVTVLVEEPILSILDCEVHREKDWWHLDGADTCSLFSMWMTRLLAEENTDSHAAEDRATQSPRPAPAMRKSQQGSTWRVGVDQEPARHADGQVEARTNSDCDNLLSITSHLHPAAPPGGSSEEEWNELYDNLPVEVQVLMDRIVDKYGGSSRATSEPRNMSASRIDLPNVWKRLQLNQMGSYTHPEHIAGEYERSWRFLTGTGIYPLTSIGFNHSCTPNLLRISVGPVIIFRTSRPVAPGEPLSISYVGTDLLREPLDLRLGDDDEDGGGLGDRDFTCVCALCTTEREAAPLPLGGSRAAVKLPVHVKGCLQLMSAKERIAAIRGLLAGGRALRDALQRVCQGVDDEDDEAGPGELDQGTGRSLSSLGLKSLAEAAAGGVEGAAGEGARNVASAPSAEPSAVGTGSGGVQRLLNKDALEVSVQLSMTLLECGRPHEALEAIRQASARARAEWLPRDTRDELQSSFALYALVAAVAVATDPCGGDGGHQGTRPCTPREAADQVVLETEAVFGWKAAAAVARHGAPSALKREIDAVCAKVPHGEEVAAAAWRTLAAAAASHWGGGEGSVASPGRVEVVTSSGEGEGAAACGASAPPAAWQQDQVRGHLASGSLGGLQADAVISSGADFSKEWEEEMLEYGYSQGDLAKMRAGEWGEGDVDV